METGGRRMTDRTVLVDHTPSGGLRAALLIDRRLMALEMDHPSNPTQIGRIMGAKAIRAVPNMGILLRLADGAEMFLQGRMEMPAPGQNVTVQVIRDGRGAKLGLATTEISRTGRALVHLPGGNRVAFSRRLDIPAERRQALENLLSTMPGGWIVRRTAAQLGDWPVEQEAKGLIREAAEPRQSGSAAPNAFRRLMCDHGTPGPIQSRVAAALRTGSSRIGVRRSLPTFWVNSTVSMRDRRCSRRSTSSPNSNNFDIPKSLCPRAAPC